MTDVLIQVGLLALFLCLVLFVLVKDKEQASKVKQLEAAIDDLIRRHFEINKKLAKQQNSQSSDDVFKEVYNDLTTLAQRILELESDIKTLQGYQEPAPFIAPPKILPREPELSAPIRSQVLNHGNEGSVLELWRQGLSPIEISRKLRLGLGTVELLIKTQSKD